MKNSSLTDKVEGWHTITTQSRQQVIYDTQN